MSCSYIVDCTKYIQWPLLNRLMMFSFCFVFLMHRPILSLVRQKTPIILPGFEVVSVSEDLSGQYSVSWESSIVYYSLFSVFMACLVCLEWKFPIGDQDQRDSTFVSREKGLTVGKRFWAKGQVRYENIQGCVCKFGPLSISMFCLPLLSRLIIILIKPLFPNRLLWCSFHQTKLEFGSPKPARREILEEEASIDFVFIPPETKERVLTEHQKEVKRTKRSDLLSGLFRKIIFFFSPIIMIWGDFSFSFAQGRHPCNVQQPGRFFGYNSFHSVHTEPRRHPVRSVHVLLINIHLLATKTLNIYKNICIYRDNLQTDRAEGAIGADDKVMSHPFTLQQ